MLFLLPGQGDGTVQSHLLPLCSLCIPDLAESCGWLFFLFLLFCLPSYAFSPYRRCSIPIQCKFFVPFFTASSFWSAQLSVLHSFTDHPWPFVFVLLPLELSCPCTFKAALVILWLHSQRSLWQPAPKPLKSYKASYINLCLNPGNFYSALNIRWDMFFSIWLIFFKLSLEWHLFLFLSESILSDLFCVLCA